MVFPSTPMIVCLPEELGFIENVTAVIKLCDNKELRIPCSHIDRYHSYCAKAWPEIFDNDSNPIPLNTEILNQEPNTSVFEGIYTFYNENYLIGDFYFVFDFYKNNNYSKNCHTKSIHFRENVNNYRRLMEVLN